MSFILNDEEKLLKETAAQFFQDKMPVAHLRALRDAKDALGFSPDLWKEMGALGLAGIVIDEAHGGAGFGYAGLGLVLEEAGRTLAPSPLVSTALLCASLLQKGGSEAQKNAHLPPIAEGASVWALALDETPHHAPDKIACRAEAAGDGFRLSGRKVFVLDGDAASHLIVAARAEEGLTLFIVDAQAKGVERVRRDMADSRNSADIVFDGVVVPAASVLGEVGGGQALLDYALARAHAGLAAEMLGGAQEVFERTLLYLKERKQFGEIIGTFQALKHRAAKMFCEIELTRSCVREALCALDDDTRGEAPLLASLAKARACDTARLVSSEGVQLHGGMGMTDEADPGLFLKRARVQAQTFGDALFHRRRFAVLSGF